MRQRAAVTEQHVMVAAKKTTKHVEKVKAKAQATAALKQIRQQVGQKWERHDIHRATKECEVAELK